MAFWQCGSLTNLAIPASVTTIGSQAIYECASLRAITVDGQNPAYSSVDGVLFDKDQTALIQCPGGRTGSYTVTNSVTNICSFAFSSCAGLTNVMIGSGVTSIGDYAFVSCASLTSAYFNTNPPSLGFDVFWASNNATVFTCPGLQTGARRLAADQLHCGGRKCKAVMAASASRQTNLDSASLGPAAWLS